MQTLNRGDGACSIIVARVTFFSSHADIRPETPGLMPMNPCPHSSSYWKTFFCPLVMTVKKPFHARGLYLVLVFNDLVFGTSIGFLRLVLNLVL